MPSPDLVPSLLAASDVLGTGWFAASAADAGPGKTVAVVGDGAVGLLAVLAARQLGLVSVEQYEALLEASERQRAVAAALASVQAEGLEPGPEELALFAAVAAGEMTTDELREWVLARYQPRPLG